ALLLPPPSKGFVYGFYLLREGILGQDAFASLRRVYVGFAAAALVGIPVGIVMGLSPLVFRQLTPIVGSMRPIPPIAWVPVTLLWFGVSNVQEYFIIFIGTLFPIILNTIAGVHDLDPIIKRAALTLGARRTDLFKVMVQGALPNIFLGLRTSLGLWWFVVVASEMVASSSGLGFLIIQSRSAMTTEGVYVGMFAVGLIGFVQDRVLVLIGRKLMPWM
ncbi:MAG: ABC transporter permease, partial [Vulcanimicrobiaceae bacterium]